MTKIKKKDVGTKIKEDDEDIIKRNDRLIDLQNNNDNDFVISDFKKW